MFASCEPSVVLLPRDVMLFFSQEPFRNEDQNDKTDHSSSSSSSSSSNGGGGGGFSDGNSLEEQSEEGVPV